MDRAYRIWVFVHVLAVVFGLGPAVALAFVGLRARNAPAPARRPMAELARDISQRVVLPLGAVVLVTGITAALVGPSDLRPFWVKAGIVLWLVLVTSGITALLTVRRIIAIQQASGGSPGEDQRAELAALGRRQAMLSGITHVTLALALFDMVWKPGS